MNQIVIKNLLLFSLAIETFCASYGIIVQNPAVIVSIIYPVAGMIFIFLMLFLPPASLPSKNLIKESPILKSVLIVIMIAIAFVTSRFWMYEIPIDPDFADMLPVIKAMDQRFLHGEWRHIYDPVYQIQNGIIPIYLPAMWLPFSLAVSLHLDMRWTTIISLLISFTTILFFTKTRKNKFYGISLVLLVSLLFWWIFAQNEEHGLITMSEEGVVIFYVVLLTIAIISDNIYFIALAASLCFLSRYSMIGWVIPFLIYMFRKNKSKNIILFAVIVITMFLLFLFIPFGSRVFKQMIFLPGEYIHFSKVVWDQTPEVFWMNLGLAKFFGRDHELLLHRVLIAGTFLIPLVFMVFCVYRKRWKLHNINLACFKLSILVFYQFIDVPYGYLFFESSFVSFIIASVLLRQVEG